MNLAALAEHSQGHGLGIENFVLVSIGVGLGLGVIIGDRLYRGASGAAGEIGYLPGHRGKADDVKPPLRRDLVESYTGAAYIVQTARTKGLPIELSSRAVFDLARDGGAWSGRSGEARYWIARNHAASEGIAFVIACIAPLLDPQMIVLGGAIGANGDLLLQPVAKHLAGFSPFQPRMVSSALGSEAVLLGATSMAVHLAKATAFGTLTGTAQA